MSSVGNRFTVGSLMAAFSVGQPEANGLVMSLKGVGAVKQAGIAKAEGKQGKGSNIWEVVLDLGEIEIPQAPDEVLNPPPVPTKPKAVTAASKPFVTTVISEGLRTAMVEYATGK